MGHFRTTVVEQAQNSSISLYTADDSPADTSCRSPRASSFYSTADPGVLLRCLAKRMHVAGATVAQEALLASSTCACIHSAHFPLINCMLELLRLRRKVT